VKVVTKCNSYNTCNSILLQLKTRHGTIINAKGKRKKKHICHIQIFRSVKHRVTGGEATLEAWTNKKNIMHFIRQNKYIATIGKIILVAWSNRKNNILI